MPSNNGKEKDVALMEKPVKNHDLIFDLPDDDSPGYLALQEEVLKFKSGLENMDKYDPNFITEMIEFMLRFVAEPEDRDEARHALKYKMSRKQYFSVLASISGKEIDPDTGEVAIEKIPPA